MVNTCAVMTGLIISYINNTILAYLALFGFTIVAILQSGKFTFPAEDKIGSIQEISNIFCASLTYIPDEATFNSCKYTFSVQTFVYSIWRDLRIFDHKFLQIQEVIFDFCHHIFSVMLVFLYLYLQHPI